MSSSFIIKGCPKDANGCITTLPAFPFHGDIYFECNGGCSVKVCGDMEVYGTITIPAGCTVTITGDLTIHQIGESSILGTLEVSGKYTSSQYNGDSG